MQSSFANSQASTAVVGLGILLGFIAFILVLVLWNRNPAAQVFTTTQAIQTLPSNFVNSLAMVLTGSSTNIAFQLGLPSNLQDGDQMNVFITPSNTVKFNLPAHLSYGDGPSSSTQNTSNGPFQIQCADGHVFVYQATRNV